MNAAEANAPEMWDALWGAEGRDTWRATTLAPIYERIAELMPAGSDVVDVGGGVGVLASILQEAGHRVRMLDSSPAAVRIARAHGVDAVLGTAREWSFGRETVVVATEVLEHLDDRDLHRVLEAAAGGRAFFSVPNDRLGPDEEPQHARKWTAIEFLRHLRRYFGDRVRVEVLGPAARLDRAKFPSDRGQPAFLLAACGFDKPFSLSFTMPVRDEATPYPPEDGRCTDVERTLASFRGVADEVVIGVDPRSRDDTRLIAEKYADAVFELTELRGPPGDEVAEGGIHFAHARNQCIARCTGDWIFMSEGHESLKSGQDVLLRLHDVVPEAARACYVLRTADGQRWGFPWLMRRGVSYKRSTHNLPMFEGRDLDEVYCVQLPQVRTDHDRIAQNGVARAKQRRVQNRLSLLQDWSVNRNANSLHYLGTEWRGYDDDKAAQYLREYVALCRNNGAMRYQTRLVLAKLLVGSGDHAGAREVLIAAAGDDWTRTDHYVWLGDVAFERGRHEEALQWYLRGATRVGDPPFTVWWIEESFYSYIPCQRLAMAYAELGQYGAALHWARRVVETLPEDVPDEMAAEAEENIKLLEGAIGGRG